MNCNNCGKELEDDEIICTQCGQDNSPETVEKKKTGMNLKKFAFPAAASFGLLLVLCWLLFFGVKGYWFPKGNNIYKKESYTANAEILQKNRNNVVATIGERKLTNAQLQVFYNRVCGDYRGQYSSLKPLDQQIFDEKTGLTWQQYLLELSLNTWKRYQILTDMALEAEFTLPAEYQQSLDNLQEELAATAENNGYSSVDELLSESVCEGCTFADFKYVMELNYYANLYFEELAADIQITQEEIVAFFEENEKALKDSGITKDSGLLVDYRKIFVEFDGDGDESTVDQWNDCKEKAEDILDQWIQMGTTEENFSNLAVEKSNDEKTAPNGGLSSYVFENYLIEVDIRHILIMPEGGTKSEDGKTTVYSDAEWEECRKKAQAVYDEYLNAEQTEERFSALAKEHSKDGNASSGGIYTNVKKGTMVEEFDAWIFDESRKTGDTGLVKTQYGYHVMYFVHRDSELNDWLFGSEHKHGDYGIVKTDGGYQIVFFVQGEEGWIRVSRDSLEEVKADELLEDLNEQHEMTVKYSKICLRK